MFRQIGRLLALAIFIPTLAVAAVPSGQGYGVGMRSCAYFAKDYAANTSAAEDIYFTWAQGFMSAINLMTMANQGVYADLHSEEMTTYKAQIRSYCNAHPLSQYVAAVLDVMKGLPKRETNSK